MEKNKKEDDWIEELDKKIINWLLIVVISALTAVLTTIAVTG